MQSVSAAFTAEEKDNSRRIAHNLQVSWKKQTTLGNRTFTIGVSTIGGADVIGINPGAVGSPGNYKYFDESDYVMGLAWERGFSIPLGGLTKALAEAELDNTSGRFLPDFMRGTSELFTSIVPRRPMIISAGFEVGGVDSVIPQFAGIIDRQPKVDERQASVELQASDYTDFFDGRFLDQEAMFTGFRSDQVYEQLFNSMGLSTAQYRLDQGLNTIPFGLFDKGTKYVDIIHQLAEAESGHVYQDEEGIFRFENRQHWDSSPHTDTQKILLTGQVLNAEAPSDDNIINVVEISSEIREKQPSQELFTLGASIELLDGVDTSMFVDFNDPVLELDTPTSADWEVWTESDGTGTEITSGITLHSISVFARSAKLTFSNSSGSNAFLTALILRGRPVKVVSELYWRARDDSSVTAFEERIKSIDNPYIQNLSWAQSLSTMLLQDYSEPENIQTVTIRAIPELQLGDKVSWKGIDWRIYHIATKLNPSEGFVQELTMLKRETRSFFTIGISLIGGVDGIAA